MLARIRAGARGWLGVSSGEPGAASGSWISMLPRLLADGKSGTLPMLGMVSVKLFLRAAEGAEGGMRMSLPVEEVVDLRVRRRPFGACGFHKAQVSTYWRAQGR